MVLQQHPPSDSLSDPDSSSDSSAVPAQINLSEIPSPLPILGPLFFFTKSHLTRLIGRQLEAQSTTVGRILTPDETQAIAYHTAKGNAIASWGPPAGSLIGLKRAYSTRADFRHPFTGPMKSADGWFDGERIRLMGREVMRGDRARAFIHGIRTTNYCILGALLSVMFSSTYGATVAAVGEARDPKLKDFANDLRTALRRKREEQKQQMTRKSDPMGQGERSAGELWMQHREGMGPARTDIEEAPSPDGAAAFKYAGDLETGDTDIRRPHAEEMRQPNPADNEENDLPLGNTAPTSRTAGSTWERIRREASSTVRNTNPTSTRSRKNRAAGHEQEANSTEKDFTFSTSEQERSYARDEAQRDFDERVERERQGGDFGSGSRRWG